MALPRPASLRVLSVIFFVMSTLSVSSGAANAQQPQGEWGDDGCFYEASGNEWVQAGCQQTGVNGETLFVSVEIVADDGFSYYYEYNYDTGVTTWYTHVVYGDGSGEWMNYDEFLALQADDTSNGGECGVMPAGQPGSECGSTATDTGSECGVMPAGQPGSTCEDLLEDDDFEDGPDTGATGEWGEDGCFYAASGNREGCLQYTDAGSPTYVSVEILGDDGYTWYYSYDYDTAVTTWFLQVTHQDGSGGWMNYDEFLQTQPGTANTENPCGVMPAGQPGSDCEAPYVAPDSVAWNVQTLSQYVHGNLNTYWGEWFATQGYQYQSPT